MTKYPGHINEDAEFVPAQVPMVERVAKAIYDCHQTIVPTSTKWEELTETTHRDAWLKYARAAIEAMREPSAAMIESAKAPYKYGISDTLNKAFGETINGYWRAMIDAALKE